MRLSTFSFYLLLLSLLGLFHQTQAQLVQTDSVISRTAFANALQTYHQYLEPETRLYRGSQYVDYAYRIHDGHPFFDTARMQKGWLFYKGVLYQGIDIIYDLAKEMVVINDPYNIYKIALINEQLDRFTVGDHLFINFTDTLNASAPHAGFYEQLYQGRISLYKKEKKLVQEDLTSGEVRRFIFHTTSYYLKKGNTYYAVNNKGSLLHVFKDRSREVRKFIRKNGLSMRKDEENTLLKVSAWYDNEAVNPVK